AREERRRGGTGPGAEQLFAGQAAFAAVSITHRILLKMSTAELSCEVEETLRPSGLTTTEPVRPTARPEAQPPTSGEARQPRSPGFWLTTPVCRLRSRTSIAPVSNAVT